MSLTDLIRTVKNLAGDGPVQWAIDLNSGRAALLITLLLDGDQDLLYIPGRTVHHASAAHRDDGKTDAKDAAIIAGQARMRRDLHPFRHSDKIAVHLRCCAHAAQTSHPTGTGQSTVYGRKPGVFPCPGKGFRLRASQCRTDAARRVTRFRDGLRRMGTARRERCLRDRHAYTAGDIAARAIAAANAQRTTVIGQEVAASVAARLAQSVLDLNAELVAVDAVIDTTFRQHRLDTIITSAPGFGYLLGAELLAATNGDLTTFNTADRLAGIAGLAPVPRDSGRRRWRTPCAAVNSVRFQVAQPGLVALRR